MVFHKQLQHRSDPAVDLPICHGTQNIVDFLVALNPICAPQTQMAASQKRGSPVEPQKREWNPLKGHPPRIRYPLCSETPHTCHPPLRCHFEVAPLLHGADAALDVAEAGLHEELALAQRKREILLLLLHESVASDGGGRRVLADLRLTHGSDAFSKTLERRRQHRKPELSSLLWY